jgi:hypothetical protein
MRPRINQQQTTIHVLVLVEYAVGINSPQSERCRFTKRTAVECFWRGARKIKDRVGQLFRLAAHSLHRNLSPMGTYLRRMKAKLGPAAATTATAHKIATLFSTLVRHQVEYDETMWAARNEERIKRLELHLKRQAQQLGYHLVPAAHATARNGIKERVPQKGYCP